MRLLGTVRWGLRSELESHPDRGIDVGPLECISIGHAIEDLAPHGAGIAVEAFGEGIDCIERNRFQAAAAVAGDVGAASRIGARGVRILVIAVICRGKVQSRERGVAYTGPREVQTLAAAEGGLRAAWNVDEGEDVAADIGK